jgi:hypothetical protein
MFLDDQKGNLRNSERGRAVARAFKGDANAVLTMEQLQTFLEDYVFNFYNGFPRGNKLSAPSILLQESVEAIGVNGVVCAMDKSLMVATAIDAPSKSYRITAQDGIRIDKGRYRSAELLHMMNRGCKRAECRLEPYDDSFIYVYDKLLERWHVAWKLRGATEQAMESSERTFTAMMRREGKEAMKAIKFEQDCMYARNRRATYAINQGSASPQVDITDRAANDECHDAPATPRRESNKLNILSVKPAKKFAGFRV